MRIPYFATFAVLTALAVPLAIAGEPAPTIGLHLSSAPARSQGQPAEDDAPVITLESLDGALSLEVHSAQDRIRQVRPGGELQKGDSFTVPADAAARVAFEEGAQTMLTGGTHAAVGREEGVPLIQLDQGEARSLVEKSTPSPEARRRLKFLIRTRTSTLGVRGTDFVTEATSDWASVHTVSGTVEMGRDSGELAAGSGVAVGPAQFTESRPGQPIAHASRYSVQQYLARFHQRHPRMQRLYQAAARDARSGKLRRRFKQVRKARAARRAGAHPNGGRKSRAKAARPVRKKGALRPARKAHPARQGRPVSHGKKKGKSKKTR